MLETQTTPQALSGSFLGSTTLDVERQALPTSHRSGVFAGLMSTNLSSGTAQKTIAGLVLEGGSSSPGFANTANASSSDLVLAQLGVTPFKSEGLLSLEDLNDVNMAEFLPGLVNIAPNLPQNLPQHLSLKASAQSTVNLGAQEVLEKNLIADMDVVGLNVSEAMVDVSKEHEFLELDTPDVSASDLSVANANSAPVSTTQEVLAASEVERNFTAADSGVEEVVRDPKTIESLAGTFDKIAAKLDKSETTTTWGTQSQSVTNAASQAQQSTAGGQSNQQSANHQAQQQQQSAQQQQFQQSVELQLKNKFSEELASAKSAESADKDRVASLLGDLGGAGDKRAQLPLGLQSINTPVRHPQWGQALGQRVVVMANQKIQEAKITLNPEKLGPVQIKLHMDKDQQIHVSMLAQHGTTREAMQDAIPKLKEMLEQAGIAFGSVDVGDHTDFQQAKEENASQSATYRSGATLGTEDLNENASLIQTNSSNNLIDYYA